jgi:stalled ribosome alternative rescue factor ArfA
VVNPLVYHFLFRTGVEQRTRQRKSGGGYDRKELDCTEQNGESAAELQGKPSKEDTIFNGNR